MTMSRVDEVMINRDAIPEFLSCQNFLLQSRKGSDLVCANLRNFGKRSELGKDFI